MMASLKVWIGRLLFWLMVSWVFPIELLSCRAFGERYASGRRAALSLFLLLILALATGLQQSWRAALPIFTFASLTGMVFVLQRAAMGGSNDSRIQPNPWGWGVPPRPFQKDPRRFWLVAQPLFSLALGLSVFSFSRVLSLYFALAAPLLWIFRKLAPPALLMQGARAAPIDTDPPPPVSAEHGRSCDLPTPWPWPSAWPAVPPAIVADADPIEAGGIARAAGRSPARLPEIAVLLLGIGAGWITALTGLRAAHGFFAATAPKEDAFASWVRTEQERLAAALPAGWSFPLRHAGEERPLSEQALHDLLLPRATSLIRAMQRSWSGEPVYFASGDFIPCAAMAVRFPVPGIVVQWTPSHLGETSGPGPMLLLYVQTKPESAKELQRTLKTSPGLPTYHFDSQSRVVVFDATRAGAQAILHCLSIRSFSFRIGTFLLSQELSEASTHGGSHPL